MKDVRDFRRARRFAGAIPAGDWDDAREIAFVWQRHDLFQTAGHDVALFVSGRRWFSASMLLLCGRPGAGESAGQGGAGCWNDLARTHY